VTRGDVARDLGSSPPVAKTRRAGEWERRRADPHADAQDPPDDVTGVRLSDPRGFLLPFLA